MKKFALAALLALSVAVPGIATNSVLPPLEVAAPSPEMDPALVDAILQAAAQESGQEFQPLRNGYDAGVVTIEKVESGYRVVFSGGHAIIGIEESF